MIFNLNQQNFQGFGTLLPERAGTQKGALRGKIHNELMLEPGEAPVYRSTCNTWVNCGTGTSVLSVSVDGVSFRNFYLDKAVCLKPGLLFSLSPFQNTSTVFLSGDDMPLRVSRRLPDQNMSLNRQLVVRSIYTFFYQEKETGFFFPGESHSMLELTYVDRGSVHSVADGQELVLNQGELAIYGPNQWHVQYADVNVAPSFLTITFEVDGEGYEPLLNRVVSLPHSAIELLQELLREQDKNDAYSADMMLCLLQHLLLILLRQADAPSTRLRTINSVQSDNATIRKAQQYITAHVRERLSVPVVAKYVDVSPSYLTALFHKNLQISPGDYIRRTKLQESKQLIREGEMNFTEIAAVLQYSTVHHFSRQFKEKFGITPSEYAKSVR